MKLRPIPDLVHEGDGYRGDQTVGWQLAYAKRPDASGARQVFEEFATWCVHCLQSWGWTGDLSQALKLHKAMKKHGCPRCAKRTASSSTKNKKVNGH